MFNNILRDRTPKYSIEFAAQMYKNRGQILIHIFKNK
jgi:hypothetical protein